MKQRDKKLTSYQSQEGHFVVAVVVVVVVVVVVAAAWHTLIFGIVTF
jgi:FlaG/FlaF family flagellin (archaellin)